MRKLIKTMRTVLFACIMVGGVCLLSGCSNGEKIIRFEDENVTMELGETFAFPSVYVYNESGKIVAKDVTLVSLHKESGEEVKLAYGAFIPQEIGEYKAVFSSAQAEITQELNVSCVDSKSPKIQFEEPAEYHIRERGTTEYKTFEIPTYATSDYSGVDQEKSGISVTLNGAAVDIEDGCFKLTEAGVVKFTIDAVDTVGNARKFVYETYAYEPYEDDDLAEGYLADFTETDYTKTLSYGYLKRPFTSEHTASYTDKNGEVREGVVKVSASGESTCNIMFAREIDRENADYIEITLCMKRASLKDSEVCPYNVAVCASGKNMWLNNPYSKAYLQENIWTTVRIGSLELLDEVAEDGILKWLTLYLMNPTSGTTDVYIDEIRFGKFYEDTALSSVVLADYSDENYVNNVVEGGSMANPMGGSPMLANSVKYLSEYTDANNVTKEGIVRAAYYEAIGDVTMKVVLAQPILRENMARLNVTLLQTGCTAYDDNIKHVMITSANQTQIWDVEYQSFSLEANQWTTVCVYNSALLDEMADEDGYIRAFNLTHFRKELSADERVIYLDKISTVTGYEDNELTEECLADFEETEYTSNVQEGSALYGGNPPASIEVLASYTDKNGGTENGVLKIVGSPNENNKFDFSVYFGAPILRKDVSYLKITIAQTGIDSSGALKTFLVTANDSNKVWEEGMYQICNVAESGWTVLQIGSSVLDNATEADGYIRSLSFFCDGGVAEGAETAVIYLADISYQPSSYTDDTIADGCLADFDESAYQLNVSAGAAILNGYAPSSAEVLTSYTDKNEVMENGVLKIVATPNENGQFDFSVHFGKAIKRTEISSITIRIAQTGIDSSTALKTFLLTANNADKVWYEGCYQIFEAEENSWVTLTLDSVQILNYATEQDGYIRSLSFFCDGGLMDGAEEAVIYVADISCQ